jgi:hypothetical protein
VFPCAAGKRYRGRIVNSEQTRDGPSEVLVEHITVISKELRWEGGEVAPKATHCREGETGCNVLQEGTMGGTQRPQTISTVILQIAQRQIMPMGSKVMRQTGCRLSG